VIAETIGKGNGRLISRAAFRGLVGSKPSEIAGDADAFRCRGNSRGHGAIPWGGGAAGTAYDNFLERRPPLRLGLYGATALWAYMPCRGTPSLRACGQRKAVSPRLSGPAA